MPITRNSTVQKHIDSITNILVRCWHALSSHHLKKGGGGLIRLLRGLIPYDPARARGKLSDAQKTKRTTREAAPKTSRKPRKSTTVISAPANPAEVQHYPTTCAFGPVKGGTTTTTTTFIGTTTSENPYEDEPAPPFDDESHMASSPLPPPQTPPTEHAEQPSVHHAVDIMSAEMLVDLATSTLAAANRVKELYVAQQSQRPVLGMTTIPTAEDIALAKQKVREAAAGMYCLVLFCLVCHYRWQEKKKERESSICFLFGDSVPHLTVLRHLTDMDICSHARPGHSKRHIKAGLMNKKKEMKRKEDMNQLRCAVWGLSWRRAQCCCCCCCTLYRDMTLHAISRVEAS